MFEKRDVSAAAAQLVELARQAARAGGGRLSAAYLVDLFRGSQSKDASGGGGDRRGREWRGQGKGWGAHREGCTRRTHARMHG